LHVGQKDTGAAINSNKLKIDLEFPFAEFKKDNGSEIEFEIKNIFNFNSDAGKLNKELYLIFRLYITISV
jgi:hypothetical protein